MKYGIDKQDKFSIFTLQEDKLNSLVAPLLKSEMILLNAEGIRNIIFDMATIRFIDSSGLSSILIANRLCKNSGGTLVLTGVKEQVMRLIQISQLNTILNIVQSLQEAKDFILMNEIEREFNEEPEA